MRCQRLARILFAPALIVAAVMAAPLSAGASSVEPAEPRGTTTETEEQQPDTSLDDPVEGADVDTADGDSPESESAIDVQVVIDALIAAGVPEDRIDDELLADLRSALGDLIEDGVLDPEAIEELQDDLADGEADELISERIALGHERRERYEAAVDEALAELGVARADGQSARDALIEAGYAPQEVKDLLPNRREVTCWIRRADDVAQSDQAHSEQRCELVRGCVSEQGDTDPGDVDDEDETPDDGAMADPESGDAGPCDQLRDDRQEERAQQREERKEQREAAKAQRQEAREAAKAERAEARDDRKQQRDLAKTERKAERDERKSRRGDAPADGAPELDDEPDDGQPGDEPGSED